MPESKTNATSLRSLLTIRFSAKRRKLCFPQGNRLRVTRFGFPEKGFPPHGHSDCAIERAQCAMQNAQRRMRNIASGFPPQANRVTQTTRMYPGDRRLIAAICGGPNASRSVRQANRSAERGGKNSRPERHPQGRAVRVSPLRGGGSAAGRIDVRRKGAPIGSVDQARRRSRTLEGASPNRVAYSRENVDRRENPHPVAMAATEASASAFSSR